MENKGQAAMEFLMTYGWAILAAIIAIGVLAYFGVFSPGRYLPEACTLTSPLGCDDNKISVATGISLVLRNGAGEDITVSSVNIVNCGIDSTSQPVADGGTATITIPTCTPVLVAGNKFNGAITVTYIKTSGGTFSHTSSGTLIGKVAA